MLTYPLPHLDWEQHLCHQLLVQPCLQPGEVWCGEHGHCVDYPGAAPRSDVMLLCSWRRALAIHDLPYNFIASGKRCTEQFIDWCRQVISNTDVVLKPDSSLSLWIGAGQKAGFVPLQELMLMMRDTAFTSRSLITLRNQCGYRAQKNRMCARRELFH